MMSPRFGSRDFSRRAFERSSMIGRARVVHVDRRLHQSVTGSRQPRPVVRRETAVPQSLRLDLRLAAHHPLGHLGLRHLEREERDRRLVANAQIRGHAEAEPDFPIDGRAARITRLPGWKPDVSRSSSLNPAGTPVISAPAS